MLWTEPTNGMHEFKRGGCRRKHSRHHHNHHSEESLVLGQDLPTTISSTTWWSTLLVGCLHRTRWSSGRRGHQRHCTRRRLWMGRHCGLLLVLRHLLDEGRRCRRRVSSSFSSNGSGGRSAGHRRRGGHNPDDIFHCWSRSLNMHTDNITNRDNNYCNMASDCSCWYRGGESTGSLVEFECKEFALAVADEGKEVFLVQASHAWCPEALTTSSALRFIYRNFYLTLHLV